MSIILGFKDRDKKKSEFIAKTQFLFTFLLHILHTSDLNGLGSKLGQPRDKQFLI